MKESFCSLTLFCDLYFCDSSCSIGEVNMAWNRLISIQNVMELRIYSHNLENIKNGWQILGTDYFIWKNCILKQDWLISVKFEWADREIHFRALDTEWRLARRRFRIVHIQLGKYESSADENQHPFHTDVALIYSRNTSIREVFSLSEKFWENYRANRCALIIYKVTCLFRVFWR